MFRTLMTISLFYSFSASAQLINLKSPLYAGKLFINNHATNQTCYLQINRVVAAPEKGKHCQRLITQWMFNLDDKINSRGDEITVTSRKTNNEADFHKPTTCAETTTNASVNKWSDDTTFLFNEVFNAVGPAVNGGENHYTVIFSAITKAPTRAMIYNMTTFTESENECVGLKSL